MSGIQKIRQWVSVAALCGSLTAVSLTNTSWGHGPFVSTTAALLAIDFSLTATTLGASAATTASSEQTVAFAVIEEAAHYYQSGEMTGLLPVAVKRLREIDPSLTDASDNELVGVLVDAVQAAVFTSPARN